MGHNKITGNKTVNREKIEQEKYGQIEKVHQRVFFISVGVLVFTKVPEQIHMNCMPLNNKKFNIE